MPVGYDKAEDRWGNRTYTLPEDPEKLYKSVTTWISKGTPKPALTNWFKKVTAECAVDNLEIITKMLEGGDRSGAIDWITGASYRTSSKATDLGKNVHSFVEAILNEWPLPEYPKEAEGFIEAIHMFIADWQPKLVKSEFVVFNTAKAYAGQCDAWLEFPLLDGQQAFVDWKTTKPGRDGHGIYPEAGLQLAAYRHGEFFIDTDGSRHKMPVVDACYGVNFRPGKYAVVPVRADANTFKQFQYVQQVALFLEQGKSIIGDPVAPPIRKVTA